MKLIVLPSTACVPTDDVDRALGKALLGFARFGRADHARQSPDLDRQAGEALGECLVMLAREQRRRRDDGDLLAIDRRAEGGAQRDFRLAETDVAANEPIHRPAGARDRRARRRSRRADPRSRHRGSARRIRRRALPAGASFGAWRSWRCAAICDEALRHFADAVLHPRLARLPADAAEPVELRLGVLAAIARQQLEILDRQIELVAAGIMDFETVVRRAGGGDASQADEAADAVIDMHDEIARRERSDFAEKIFVRLALAAATHERSPRMSCSPSSA